MRSILDSLTRCLIWVIGTFGMNVPTMFFRSREEIVAHLMKNLPDDTKQIIREMEESELIRLHFTTGMAIRNHYWLWDPHNPYTKGYQDGQDPRHPDNLSYQIIVDLWTALQEDQ